MEQLTTGSLLLCAPFMAHGPILDLVLAAAGVLANFCSQTLCQKVGCEQHFAYGFVEKVRIPESALPYISGLFIRAR